MKLKHNIFFSFTYTLLTTIIILNSAFLILNSSAFAVPYNSPTIDGSITIAADDWDNDELVGDDPPDDSHWVGNDFDNLWLTWDANYLYIGSEFTISSNTMIVYLETDIDGGVTDFNSTRGYTGSFNRNITFPDSIGIDLMFAGWDGDIPNVYLCADSSSSDITSSCVIASGGSYIQELAIPWSLIYPDAIEIITPGVGLRIVAIIAGGDDYGATDALPDNPGIDGGEGPHNLTEYIEIAIDENGDGIPDFSGESTTGIVTFNDPDFSSAPYPEAALDVFLHETGEFIVSTYSAIDNGSYTVAGLESGISYDLIASANGFKPDSALDYTVTTGDNIVDFTLEPYTGSIYGIITPSDFQTIIYAMHAHEIIGFGDTTEIDDGSYEITHLPDDLYDIVVEPQSIDYTGQVIEGIEVAQDSAVELNIELDRAGVIREATDATGDDYGPGWFTYPTEPVFVESAFDIEYVKIRDIASENAWQFEIKVGDMPDSSVVEWNPEYDYLNLQKIDIYIDCHADGALVGLPNRNITFAATDAWDFCILIDGWWSGLFASNGQDIFANFTQYSTAVEVEVDTVTDKIFVTITKSAFVDNLGIADTAAFEGWDFIVCMSGHDGDGIEGVRSVNSGTANQWNFNNGEDGDIDPNIIDILAMPGLDAYGNPKNPGRTQEEMLDYTIESPVALESHESSDILPPTIEYEIPDEIIYLAGAGGVYFEVDIDDDVEVSSAYLHWRNIGDANWRTPIPLGLRELTNSWVGDIPFAQVNSDSFEFYFWADDPSGNISYHPQDYAAPSEPAPPNYPFSTVSANPTRIVPAIETIDSSISKFAVNSFMGGKETKFPDGAILIIDRDEIASDIDTINVYYICRDEQSGATAPELEPIGQYRQLAIFSENGFGNIFEENIDISFHYFESTDSGFTDSDEQNFVVASLNNKTDVWISLGGKNDIYANTIDFGSESARAIVFGLFSATNLSPGDEPIRQIIKSPHPFSPNGDGIYDEINITLDLKYDGNIDLIVFDMQGRQVKKLAQNLQVYEGRNENILWDGKDENNESQPLGIYLMAVRLTYIFEGQERVFRKNEAIVIIK